MSTERRDYYNTIPARPADAVIKVDYYVRGCPPATSELVKVIKALLLNKKPDIPNYPVCVECKMAGNICVYEKGQTCPGRLSGQGATRMYKQRQNIAGVAATG